MQLIFHLVLLISAEKEHRGALVCSEKVVPSLLLDPAHLLWAPDLHAALGAATGSAEDEHGAAIGRRHLAELGLKLAVRVPEIHGARPLGREQRRSRRAAAHAVLRLELDVELDGLLEAPAPRPAALARVVAHDPPPERRPGDGRGGGGEGEDGGETAGRGRVEQRGHLEQQQLDVRDHEEAQRGRHGEEHERVDRGHRPVVA